MPTKLGRMVAERACVLMGGCFWPGAGRMMFRLLGVLEDM